MYARHRRDHHEKSGMKILVVEDDPFVREMALAGLEEAGFEVIEAGSGDDALRLLQAGLPLMPC